MPDNSNTSNQTGSQQTGNKRGVATTLAEEMMIGTEAAVMANFDFLSSEVEIVNKSGNYSLSADFLANSSYILEELAQFCLNFDR